METLLFVLQSFLVVLLCFMTLKDERRPRGSVASSLFRYRSFVPGTYREGAAHDPSGKPRR